MSKGLHLPSSPSHSLEAENLDLAWPRRRFEDLFAASGIQLSLPVPSLVMTSYPT